ncbi:MAG: class I SAM-dependent methyltransferase [Candidatus Aminicenantia bacterium]
MEKTPWQIKIFNKSLKKKEKLKLIEQYLPIEDNFLILDLGCAQGTLSYFLRKKGGTWISGDLDFDNLKTAKEILKKNLIQIDQERIPFLDNSFDLIVTLDYLEHLKEDDQCLREIYRVLKLGGKVLISTPLTGKFYLLHKLRRLLGMKPEFYGHQREGYRVKELTEKLETNKFAIINFKTYSKFFSELIELIINFIYVKFLSRRKKTTLRNGLISPSSEQELNAHQKSFKFYSLIYPILWIATQLDRLLFFKKGYASLIWAKKEMRNVKCKM